MTRNALPAGERLAIVDAHHHLWQLDGGHYPWLQEGYQPATFFLGDYQALRHDYLAAEYRRDTADVSVLATVHIEAERDRGEAIAETAWTAWERKSWDRFAAAAGLMPNLYGHWE